jgi:hypothetical protein
MALLDRSLLKPRRIYAARGTLWRISVDGAGRVIGEDRDLVHRSVRFFCVEARTGKVLWESLRGDEDWWTGIEAIHGDVLLLHGFATPDLPGHRGITAFNIPDGRRLWSMPDATYRGFAEARVLASRDSTYGGEFISLDPATGDVRRSSDNESAVRHQDADTEPAVAFPEWIGLDEARSLPEFQRMRTLLPPAATAMVGVYRDPHALLVSFYLPAESNPPLLNGIIMMADPSEGRVLMSDVLHAGVVAPVRDSWFVAYGILFFIQERAALCAVQFPE